MSAPTSPSAKHHHGGTDQDAAARQGVTTAPSDTTRCRRGVGWLGDARPIDAAISAGGSTDFTRALVASVLERGLRLKAMPQGPGSSSVKRSAREKLGRLRVGQSGD